MDATSSEQQRREAAEKRREAFLGEGVDPEQARRSHPRLAETRNGSRGATDGDTQPSVHDRYLAFPAEMRAEIVEQDDKKHYRVEGYASTFSRAYEMWDVFGPYEEEVVEGAADATLAAKPDVVFLINHRGLAMARTAGPWNLNKGTLELSADATGLRDVVWLNPERADVRDLILAMDDKIVTEQSFAFMIDEGLWNEDFTKFQIVRFDINRGDVSAVNYGANPYTSIAARQQEILTDLRLAGPATVRAAWAELSKRTDVVDELEAHYQQVRNSPPLVVDEPKGFTLDYVEALLAEG